MGGVGRRGEWNVVNVCFLWIRGFGNLYFEVLYIYICMEMYI